MSYNSTRQSDNDFSWEYNVVRHITIPLSNFGCRGNRGHHRLSNYSLFHNYSKIGHMTSTKMLIHKNRWGVKCLGYYGDNAIDDEVIELLHNFIP